jgi:hypothetical protein
MDKEVATYAFNVLTILEGIGLVIALLDFKGWSKRLQSTIDTGQYKIFLWLRGKGHEKLADAFAGFIGLPGMILFGWGLYALFFRSDWSALGWWLLVTLGPILFLLVLLPILYNSFRLINRAESGVLGTIGLFVALGSFTLHTFGAH